ncbi:MAG: thiazole synthase [Proteobacteria bacterium]|jgi:thiazole synthase|nr:thiazole synthase [Desulfocapsa sp.]MBU3945384.1 thiazole synthase [Pseudomonadota bacterium]MCG2744162.1 thiazole synthase [Desulfobacteraceae bacterium]MDO8947462.1 thiazole synthase [Desulfocapsaceae bacterium]MBU3984548.1 thiazole synthase [Pseudomonadota bacterium]
MLTIGGHTFNSRLFLGTGKFSSSAVMKQAIEASGTEMVTVALRRVDLDNPEDDIMSALNRDKCVFLPNTSGARNAEEAIRLAHLARAASGSSWLKLEVTPDPRTLLPDPIETLKATEELVRAGFIVLPYMNADPILALRLQDVGAAAVMPLGSPIGTNQGILTAFQIEIIINQARVPVVVDAGIGAPSHAALAMEMGADAVLVNTAISVAGDPVAMARAFAQAVEAGRTAFVAGMGCRSKQAQASSPLEGVLATDLGFLA